MDKKFKNALNKTIKEMLGPPMTTEEKAYLETLRYRVKEKEITIAKAKELWKNRNGQSLKDRSIGGN